MSILAILVSVISASYYLKIVRIVFTTDEIHKFSTSEQTISNTHSFIISTLTLSILFFILRPSILLNSTQLLSLTLFNC